MRRALRCPGRRGAGKVDADVWTKRPLTRTEFVVADVAHWGPAEDWSDWSDAAR